MNEQTSDKISAIAGKVLGMDIKPKTIVAVSATGKSLTWREVCSLAASCLTQSRDKKSKKG